jgi:formate dehydrogenase subunit delta
MNLHNLIDMANRIGDFFDSMPDRDAALDDVAEHIKRFWEPRMRRALLDALDTPAADTLHPFVREAVVRHRERLMPAAVPA